MDNLSDLTVAQIRAHIKTLDAPDEGFLQALEQDTRTGVQALATQERKRRKARAQEQARLEQMLILEKKLRERGLAHIAGVDEAGRGPLAGPVVAAAVILPPNTLIAGLNDSKVLSEQQRETLFEIIPQVALAVGVGEASPQEIDDLNIRNATHLAMRRALDALNIEPDRVLVDGNAVPESKFSEQAIIGGDGASLSIAAASVIAKVTRDRQMRTYDQQYPLYGFAKHKGYGSGDHLTALRKHGPCPIHRKSFGGVLEVSQERSEDFEIFAEGIHSAQNPEQLEAIGTAIASASDQMDKSEIDTLRTLFRKRRNRLQQSGPKGEQLAEKFLSNRGYKILAKGYRAVGGEIDLVAQKNSTLAFVEVKTATTHRFGPPAARVTPHKQAQIIKVAKVYLQRQNTPVEPRFDVIAVDLTTPRPKIYHYENAFIAPA